MIKIILSVKFTSRLFTTLFTIVMVLAGLINSAAYPTNVYALGVLITVTTASDNTNTDTVCSLREAIINANTNSAFYPDCGSGLANDTIVFADALGAATITLSSALPAISDTWGLTIKGGGDIFISGNNFLYQVFYLNTSVPLTLDGLTVVSGGGGNGGAIFNYFGKLTITNSTVYGNYASTTGGGIYNLGTLTLTNSTISGNTANATGGGIYNLGTLTITNSTLSYNGATTTGGGIDNLGTLTITNSTILGNKTGTTVADTTDTTGGGIYNGGTLTITNSTFSDNESYIGGAINNPSGSSATITNSTFYYNATGYRSVGTILGGAIYNAGTLNLTNNTISGNVAFTNHGGGIYNSTGGTLNQFNNIIANNNGGDCVNLSTLSGKNNLITSTGSNACGLTNGINGNVIGSDPNLGTQTGFPTYFPLLAGSPAIDAGTDNGCPTTDQRGTTRPQGTFCDIGSFEYVSKLLFLPLILR